MNDSTFQGNEKIAYVPVIVNAKTKPTTHGDSIRAMSDEELAEWLECVAPSEKWRYWLNDKTWLDWLKQEANDGD